MIIVMADRFLILREKDKSIHLQVTQEVLAKLNEDGKSIGPYDDEAFEEIVRRIQEERKDKNLPEGKINDNWILEAASEFRGEDGK